MRTKESGSTTVPEPGFDSKFEAQADSKLESNVDSKTHSEPEQKLDAKVEPKLEPRLELDFGANSIEPVITDGTGSNWAEIWALAGAAVAREKSSEDKPQEPPVRRIAQREISDVLESHHLWLTSERVNGEQADLAGAQLQGTDLTGADLRRAILHKANLDGAELFMADCQNASLPQSNLANANLLGAQLQRADLQGAKLDGAIGLQLSQLAGADLRGATLPGSLSESAAIARVRQLSKSAVTMLASMLSVCVLACARIFTATDAQLIRNSSALPLVHSGNALPMMAFFLMMPVLLLGLCIATHLRLFRLWEAVEESPETFPSGKRLVDCGPWIVMSLGFSQFQWLRDRRVALSWLEAAIASFLAYWIPPLVLIAFWARYLTFQDLNGAILDVLLTVFAIGLGTILPALNAKKLFRRTPWAESAKSLFADSVLRPRAALALVGGVILFLLSVGVIFGTPRAGTGNTHPGASGVATWAANVLWLAHIDPYANLAEQDISTRPAAASSNGGSQDDALALTRGAQLRGRNLRHAQAYRAFLAKADLWDANLQSADLSEADLRFADLHRSSLRGALLNHAQLSHANMEGSDLTGADLFEASLGRANLSSATLSKAILNGADFESANLYGADLHESQLANANFKGADLRSANLGQADLPDALLQDSYLSSAKFFSANLRRAHLAHAFLTQADLRQADLRGADLQNATMTDADLRGANLSGADLRAASGLVITQICSANFNNETQFDDALALQVSVTCPQK